MNMNISISNKAYNNMQNITKFTAKISTNYSNRVMLDIYDTIDSIKDTPYIYWKVCSRTLGQALSRTNLWKL